MEPTIPGLTVREIAEKYGRSERTIEQWQAVYDWPAATGTRAGRQLEYDPGEVAAAVGKILGTGDRDADPGELLDARQAADDAGISYATVRADISRGRWPQPDRDGKWLRSTVRAEMDSRRPHRRRRAGGQEEKGTGAGEGREETVRCLLLFGDQAELVLEGAEAGDPVRWTAAAIAAEAGMEPGEIPGTRFRVRVLEHDGAVTFSGFRRAAG